MEKFSYITKDKDSNTKRGVVESNSKDEAVRYLQAQGLYIISIESMAKKRSKGPRKGGSLSFQHSAINLEDLSLFSRQLATLLSSGVPLLRSLEVVSSQCGSRGLSAVLHSIGKDIKRGLSLTEAITKYPHVFSSLWRGLVETGEASGNLSGVLEKLAGYLEMRQEFLRKLISAIIYPFVLLFAAVGALLFFAFVIIPRFQDIFNQFDVKLPFLTEILFGMVAFTQNNFVVLLIATVASVVGFRVFSRTPRGKAFLDTAQLKVPFFNTFFHAYYLERFSSTAYILFESGVPVVYALDVMQRSVGNTMFEDVLTVVRDGVKTGRSLSSELTASGFFPPMLIEMTAVGEEVGNFPEMFAKISKHYQVSLQTKVERFTSLFEPLMILSMGLLIGIIVISLFLPLFQIASAMK